MTPGAMFSSACSTDLWTDAAPPVGHHGSSAKTIAPGICDGFWSTFACELLAVDVDELWHLGFVSSHPFSIPNSEIKPLCLGFFLDATVRYT